MPVGTTWWYTPHRTRARCVLFQVHLWLGLLLGLYTVVIGVTGSALVFLPELTAMHPAASGGGAGRTFALTPVLARIAAAYPREQVLGVDNLDHPALAAVVYLDAPDADWVKGEQRMVSVDQRTGAILGERLRYTGLLGTCANLHIYLLSGETGYVVNGICACLFLLLCLTGWLLWWPGARSVGNGLRVHWRARWKRLNRDLHAVGGFWTNPLLILVILTGILFVFPRPVLVALSTLTGGDRQAVSAWLALPSSARTAGPVMDADAALAWARRVLGAQAAEYSVRYLSLPGTGNEMFDAIAYPRGGADYAMPIDVYIASRGGAILGVHDARKLPVGMRWATYAYAVHFGTFAGIASRIVWVLVGLMPAALWTTGLLLWWNRELRRLREALAR
jgi:uncharacterized iron-regulated membrane protein